MKLNELLPLIAGEKYIIQDQYGDPQDVHDVADWDVLKVLPRLQEDDVGYGSNYVGCLLIIVLDGDTKHDDDFFNAI